jgi:hypothetical protein
MYFFLSILFIRHLLAAADIDFDFIETKPEVAARLLQEDLNKFFTAKEPTSFYPHGSVTIQCRPFGEMRRHRVFTIECSATVNSDEMKRSGFLAAFRVALNHEDLDIERVIENYGLEANGGIEECLKDLFLDPEWFDRGIRFSPYHKTRFKIYLPEHKHHSYSYYLLADTVRGALEENRELFFYILTDMRTAFRHGDGPHLVPASCKAFFEQNHQLSIKPLPSTDNTSVFIQGCQGKLNVLKQLFDSFKATVEKHRLEKRAGTPDYSVLITALPKEGPQFASAYTNIRRENLNLTQIFEKAGRMLQNMCHVDPRGSPPNHLIDASKIVPLLTGSPDVPNTKAVLGNYMCRRMIHHPKIWLSLRNQESDYAYEKPSKEAYEKFEIMNNQAHEKSEISPGLAYIKFHVKNGFYGLMIWEMDSELLTMPYKLQTSIEDF